MKYQRHEPRWWKDGVVYQIYPASFKDSNGDGLGDLPGIISKLDYLRNLGIDVLWICPMYDSPQVDMGYDISNYETVYPPYGSLDDMVTLIEETHKRGMKILVDLVINHTSDQHAWFKESRSSKDSPKRDWYIWRPARYDEKGTWDEHTQEYYLHLFCPEQPDLNWEKEETRHAIYESAMHFWLKKGVDGFRVDTVNMYSKFDFEDVPVTDYHSSHQPAAEKYTNGPRMHEYLREMNKDVFSKYGDVMTVGELPNTKDMDRVLKYISASDPQLSMVFQFEIVDLGTGALAGLPKFEYTPWKLTQFKDLWTHMQQFTTGTDGWATSFLENHDQGRSVSRYGSEKPEYRALSAKMLSTLLATSSGTLFVYQGQEIGMYNAPHSWNLEEYLDVDSKNYIEFVKNWSKSDPKELEKARQSLQLLARDHSRLPMQWDGSPNSGFSTPSAKTWMRVHDNFSEVNVQQQQSDPNSVLSHWKKMLKIRREYHELFVYGDVVNLNPESQEAFIYAKHLQGQRDGQAALVALNFTDKDVEWSASDEFVRSGELLIANYPGKPGINEKLRPWEARVYLIPEAN